MKARSAFLYALVAVVIAAATLAAAPALASEPTPTTIAGTWLGTLDLKVAKLRLGVALTTTPAGGLTAVLTSIDQGGVEVPITTAELDGVQLTLAAPAIAAEFRGEVADSGDAIRGEWSQGPQRVPLVFERVDRLPGVERPQEPKAPLPYDVEEVRIVNPWAADVQLAGTLTLPRGAGPHPAVVLISGSGPQDRDESLMGHKPFLVLADALTRRGIAVLRYDDRGYGDSTGNHAAATSKEFATDAMAALRFLAQRDDVAANKIGLSGHSEGGLIAPMAAARFPEEVAFAVLLAPPGVSGREIILEQAAAMEPAMGITPEQAAALRAFRTEAMDLAMDGMPRDEMAARLTGTASEAARLLAASELERSAVEASLATSVEQFTTPWFRYFLKLDPAKVLVRVRCPVLAVFGEKDLQVLPSQNEGPLASALAAAPSRDVTVRVLPGLNHLLQTADTGLPVEYSTIEETMSPDALTLIGDWIVARFGDE